MQTVIIIHDQIRQVCENYFGKFSRCLQGDKFILRSLNNNSGGVN